MSTHTVPLVALSLLIFVTVPALLRAWNIGQALDEALEAVHVTRKEAAAAMGYASEAQLSRAIAGVGPEHLSADRMTRLPRLVWLQLLVEIGAQYGVADPSAERAERLARVTARQAKAGLRREREVQCA